ESFACGRADVVWPPQLPRSLPGGRRFVPAGPRGVGACAREGARPTPGEDETPRSQSRAGRGRASWGQLVEMGGIEPPSRNFRREYPTSVVEVLDLASGAALDGVPLRPAGWSYAPLSPRWGARHPD